MFVESKFIFFFELLKFYVYFTKNNGIIRDDIEGIVLFYRVVYSVQIRDVGRFLAKFNPWTNTFGNRLDRLHCSRIHPSVKLHTKSIYL